MKKLTSYTKHLTAEGIRLSGTYSEIDESGKLTQQNTRFNIIVLDTDTEAIKAIKVIDEYMTGKIPE